MGKFLLMMLMNAMKMASPSIIASIQAQVDDMVRRAKETTNPWDDVFCAFLQQIVGKPADGQAERDLN